MLLYLRKKFVAAEAGLTEAASVCLCAEAMKAKRNKKELGVLLKISIGDKVIPEERLCSKIPGGIGGIPQLVTRMLFTGHKAIRLIAHCKAGMSDQDASCCPVRAECATEWGASSDSNMISLD